MLLMPLILLLLMLMIFFLVYDAHADDLDVGAYVDDALVLS